MSTLEALMHARYDNARRKTYLALDVHTREEALALVDQFSPAVDGYKVGLELFHAAGMSLVEELLKLNLRVFLDVKLHDIPNTVAGALRAICEYPIEMVNVHAQGGIGMLQAARDAVLQGTYQPLLIGVTILTSLGSDDLKLLGVNGRTDDAVDRLARLCVDAGLDGIVCSAQELSSLRGWVPERFERVVPGTRFVTDSMHDQRRSMTPTSAIQAGATRLVFGRGVRMAEDKLSALQAYWDAMIQEGDKL